MIRYDVTPAQLEALVDGHEPTWRTRAAARTAELRRKAKYSEASSIWGEIKAVFMTVQGDGKCCYCERKFDGNFAQYELDLEHFRPKGRVRKWRRPKSLVGKGIAPTSPPRAEQRILSSLVPSVELRSSLQTVQFGAQEELFSNFGSIRFRWNGSDDDAS